MSNNNIHTLFNKEKEQKGDNKNPIYFWKQKDGSRIPVYAEYTSYGKDELQKPTCVLSIGGFKDPKFCCVDDRATKVDEAFNKYTSYMVKQGEKIPNGYHLLRVMIDEKSAEKKTKEEKRKEMECERIKKYFGELKNGVSIEDSQNTSNIENKKNIAKDKKKESIRMQEELKTWEGSNYISKGEGGYKFKIARNLPLLEHLVIKYLNVKIDLTTTEQLLNNPGTKFETFVKKFKEEAIIQKEKKISYEELEKFFVDIGFKSEFEEKVTYANSAVINVNNNTSAIYNPERQPESAHWNNYNSDAINENSFNYLDLSGIDINDSSLPFYNTSSFEVSELLNNYNNINLPYNNYRNELDGFSLESYEQPDIEYIYDVENNDLDCSYSSKPDNYYNKQTDEWQQINNNVNYNTYSNYPYTYHDGLFYL